MEAVLFLLVGAAAGAVAAFVVSMRRAQRYRWHGTWEGHGLRVVCAGDDVWLSVDESCIARGSPGSWLFGEIGVGTRWTGASVRRAEVRARAVRIGDRVDFEIWVDGRRLNAPPGPEVADARLVAVTASMQALRAHPDPRIPAAIAEMELELEPLRRMLVELASMRAQGVEVGDPERQVFARLDSLGSRLGQLQAALDEARSVEPSRAVDELLERLSAEREVDRAARRDHARRAAARQST